jgi:FkbM family methyltransferase
MSKSIARFIAGFGRLMTMPLNSFRGISCRATAAQYLIDIVPVKTPHGELKMYCNSRQAAQFPSIFMTHEPDTFAWIDAIPDNSVVWDIGANVGIYTMYAGIAGHQVLAFEPASSTYFTLLKNLEINGLLDRADAYCLAFDDQTRLGKLNMSGNISGSAMHAFERNTHSGDAEIPIKIAHPTMGFTIDDFISFFNPPLPTHIKLDVDSTEQEIIMGARSLLSSHTVQSIWIEVEGDLERQRNQGIIAELDCLGYVPKLEGNRIRNLEFTRKFDHD